MRANAFARRFFLRKILPCERAREVIFFLQIAVRIQTDVHGNLDCDAENRAVCRARMDVHRMLHETEFGSV
jgi:hypothetical protein